MADTFTVVITGAGGFVLRHVVDVLLRAGVHVVAVDQRFDPALQAAWSARGATILQADAACLPPLDDVDALILGAAMTATPEEAGMSPEAYVEREMGVCLHGFAWAQTQRVRRLIALSSDAIYSSSDGPINEDMPPQPSSAYAVVKATVEALCRTYKAVYGRDCAAVRLSSIYGIDEAPSPSRPRVSLIGQMIHDARTTGRLQPSDEPARDWTLASDVGHALLALLRAPTLPHAVYNLASEQRATPYQIAQHLQALIPNLTIDPPVLPPTPRLRRGWLSHWRLATDVGFTRWTPLPDGLRQAVQAATPLTEAL